MAAINVRPQMTSTTTASLATATTADHPYTVPAGKRWLFDVIELEADTQHANLDVDIQFGPGGAGYANIWPQEDDFRKVAVHLASKYPRAPEAEAGDVIRVHWNNTSGSTITNCISRLFYIERDI